MGNIGSYCSKATEKKELKKSMKCQREFCRYAADRAKIEWPLKYYDPTIWGRLVAITGHANYIRRPQGVNFLLTMNKHNIGLQLKQLPSLELRHDDAYEVYIYREEQEDAVHTSSYNPRVFLLDTGTFETYLNSSLVPKGEPVLVVSYDFISFLAPPPELHSKDRSKDSDVQPVTFQFRSVNQPTYGSLTVSKSLEDYTKLKSQLIIELKGELKAQLMADLKADQTLNSINI